MIDPPSLLLEIESPGFAAPPPTVLHEERVPPEIRAACAAQRSGGFGARPVRVWLLRDVFVLCEGLVFDRGGCLFEPSLSQHHPLEVDWARGQVADAIAGAEVPSHPDLPLVLGKKRGAANYGHWLLEMLPALHLARDRLRDAPLGVLVQDATEPQLGGVMLDSLRRIGVQDHLVRVSDARPVRVERLLLVEGLTAHGVYMSPLVAPCIAALADGIAGQGYERVFVCRGPDMRRDFADPARVAALAREAGFFVMDPVGMTLPAQIACLRDARLVAGAMGAAMTNLVFAAPGAQIRMFAGACMPDTFFWFAATVTGRGYGEMRCEQAEEVRGLFYDRALLVPDDDVRRFLRA